MTLQKLIINRLSEQFTKALPEGAGLLAPRNGYYVVKEVIFRQIGLKGEIPIAIVNWKPDLNGPFLEDVIFEIALVSLRSANPNITELDFNSLIGNFLSIYDSGICYQIVNGDKKPVLNCKYAILGITPQFIDTKTAVLNAFFDTSSNLKEAIANFESRSGVDFGGALEWEASLSHIYLDDPSQYENDFDEEYDFETENEAS